EFFTLLVFRRVLFRSSASTRSRLRERRTRWPPVASLRTWVALAGRALARPERDSARVTPAAAALRSVASRVPGRYSTTKRWNASWSPGAADRLDVSAANFGFLPAVAPVTPMAAITAMARVQIGRAHV